jgi:hypothetical protein
VATFLLHEATAPRPLSYGSTARIEFTWPIVLANWIAPRCTIASIVGLNITLASPCGGFLAARNVYHSSLPPPVAVEAAPTFPLAPGVCRRVCGEGQRKGAG